MSAAAERLERGVWWAPFTKKGCRVLLVVMSSGETKTFRVLPNADTTLLIRRLEVWLDQVDPPRRLQLVKDGPSSKPIPLTAEQLNTIYRESSGLAQFLAQRKREAKRGALPPLPRFR